jgi:hypothetical protein
MTAVKKKIDDRLRPQSEFTITTKRALVDIKPQAFAA